MLPRRHTDHLNSIVFKSWFNRCKPDKLIHLKCPSVVKCSMKIRIDSYLRMLELRSKRLDNAVCLDQYIFDNYSNCSALRMISPMFEKWFALIIFIYQLFIWPLNGLILLFMYLLSKDKILFLFQIQVHWLFFHMWCKD